MAKILIVEDDEGDLDYILEYLNDKEVLERFKTSFEISTAERLSAAKDILESKEIELVLLDLSLPDSQGLNTFISLNKDFPNTPVIIITGLNDVDVSEKALEAGAKLYLIKGFLDRDELIRKMLSVIARYSK